MIRKTVISCNAKDGELISFTEEYTVNSKTHICVPMQYKALVYIDDKSMFRLDPCPKIKFVKKFGKDYLGCRLRIAYIKWCNLKCINWNIDAFPYELEDGSRLFISGAGSSKAEITNYPRLISAFPEKKVITEDDICSKLLTAIKNTCFKMVADEVFLLIKDNKEADKDEIEKKVFGYIDGCMFLSGIGMRLCSFDIRNVDYKREMPAKTE